MWHSVVATLEEGEAKAAAWSPSPTCGRKERGKLGLLFLFPLSFFPLPLPASRKEFGGAGGQKEEKGGGRKKAHEMRLGGGGRGEAQGTTCLFLHFLRDEITNFSRFFFKVLNAF